MRNTLLEFLNAALLGVVALPCRAGLHRYLPPDPYCCAKTWCFYCGRERSADDAGR